MRGIEDNVRPIAMDRRMTIRAAVTAVLNRLLGDQHQPYDITHQTFNGGMTGDRISLIRLQVATANGLSPAYTSGAGLLCGPRALAMSLQAARRVYYGRISPAVYDNPVTSDMLRALLFENWDDEAPDAVGIPTEAYQRYIDERTAASDDYVAGDQYTELTQLNDMDEAQLVAMVVLAHQAGLIETHFSVGVARGSQIDEAGVVRPAFVRVVHTGDENAPTVFLHHNMAASTEEYSHWEGFDNHTEDTDTEVIFEWGVATPLANDAPRLRFDPNMAVSLSLQHESTITDVLVGGVTVRRPDCETAARGGECTAQTQPESDGVQKRVHTMPTDRQAQHLSTHTWAHLLRRL